MSTESSSKNASVAVFHIAINTGENIARALRRFLTSVKYANVKYGEAHYRNYLKGNKGHKFKSEFAFAHVAYDVKKSDVERIPVSARDKEIIESMTHNMNIDYCLMRRPDDLEELVKKAVTDGNSLTDFEKKIVTAFTIRDENNQIVMNPESPDMPVINDAEYMLTICSIDLAKWEVITRELEVLSHRPSLMNRLKDAKLMNIVSRIFNKTKEHTQERETEFSYVQNQVQEQTNKNDYKDRVPVNPFVDEGTPEVVFDEPRDAVRKILYYFLPKVASYNDLKEVLKQLGFNIHDKYELNNVFKFTADESLKVEQIENIPALANHNVSWFRMPKTNGDQFIEIPNKYISWNEKTNGDGSTATIELPLNKKFKVRNSEQLFRPFYKDDSNKGMQTVEEFRSFWEDKTKQDIFTISLPDSDLEVDFSSIDDVNGNPYTLESIESFIKDNERTDNAEIVYTILNTDAENLGELQDRVFKKANIHLEQQTDEMISEKPILETIPPDISMKRCLDFLVPKVKSYEDLKECLELIGFSIRDSMFNANTSVDDFMNNTKNMQFKVINMDNWKSTSNLKGFDGLDYSLQSILDRIEDNSRSESVSVVKDLLDCRSMDEIDVMVDRVLAMAHVKDDIPVEENKDVPDMEFINSLNADQLNHYINHFAQDDKSLKYAKKRLKKMNISKQKTTSRENRKPTRVREDRTV